MLIDVKDGKIQFEVEDKPPEWLPGLRTKRQGSGKPWLATCPATALHFARLERKYKCTLTANAAHAEREAIIAYNAFARPSGDNDLPSALPLYPHQVKAIQALKARNFRGLLFDDMGLGKTQVAITCFRMSGAQRLLVVCPASVKWKWRKELGDNGLTSIVMATGMGSARWDHPMPAIVNYDLLSVKPALVQQLADYVQDAFLILDESHYVKDAKAKRSKAVATFSPRHVLLLTGTPVRNSIVDLYHQIQLVEPMWRNQWEFEDRYLIKKEKFLGKRSVWLPVGTKNEAELQEVLSHVQVRRLKADVLDLPAKTYTTVELELDEEAREAYEVMRDRWIYHYRDLPDALSVFDQRAQSAVEAAMRLEQIAQGFLAPIPETLLDKFDRAEMAVGKTRTYAAKPFLKPAKLEWLKELVEDLRASKRKLVVFYKFNLSLAIAHRTLGGIAMTGDTVTAERGGLIESFQDPKGPDLFHIQVKIAEGFDLVAAQDCVFFGRDWSPGVNSQAEDRLHRIGQRGTVNVFLPIVRGTVEEYMARRLADKGNRAALVLGDLKAAVEQGHP